MMLLLAACSSDEIKRVEISLSGDAGKYNTVVCAEVTWNAETSSYTLDACSADPVAGAFSTNLVSQPLSKDSDTFDHVGKVYMAFANMPVFGVVTSISEPEVDGDVAKIDMKVTFEGKGSGGGGQGGGFQGN